MAAPVRRFPTTQWSMVFTAQGVKTPDAREALERLFAIYWYPVYAFIRSRTPQEADAEDLTQGFFASLIGLRSLDAVRPEYGRFRAFLLASAKHYLAAERARDRTQKRGGAATILPLDFASADARYRLESPDASNPELTFERQWAHATFDAALEKLRQEFAAAGKAVLFEALRQYLTAGAQPMSYADVGAALGMSEAAVKVAVHRARRRFGQLLRDQIAETVAEGKRAVHDEVRYLLRMLAG
jgi:RNA polymerase sigma factor (sigma-70 family)